MFQLIHYVEVADDKDSFIEVPFISDITIEKSISNLADTANITVSIFNFNNLIKTEDDFIFYKIFKRGQRIRIFLGYEPTLRLEFVGYVKEIRTNDDVMKLECEDELFQFREKKIPNKTFTPGNVKQIVNHVARLVNKKIKVICDYDMGYEKFTIIDATGYDVLKQIQEDTGADIYFKSKLSSQIGQTIETDDINYSSQLSGKELQITSNNSIALDDTLELHISAPFIKKNTDVDCDFSFQHNIETSQLQYEDSKDKKVQVKITSVSISGVNVTEEFGSTGGTVKEIKVNRMSKESMKKRAKLEHEKAIRPQYSGTFDSWLIPFVEPNYSISIEDEDFPEKDGIYNVESVTTSYSEAGGKRTITPSFKLSKDINESNKE
ncbi:hypothetical protein [Epilithonimonas vandammei]|uniref:hypothetical protein n=1 Tax=Epilithonimonas vandammei TaxID=2487072 RepID=UPI0028AC5462|nr:hypothetical protein [Epilithonimonas vandammei]